MEENLTVLLKKLLFLEKINLFRSLHYNKYIYIYNYFPGVDPKGDFNIFNILSDIKTKLLLYKNSQ